MKKCKIKILLCVIILTIIGIIMIYSASSILAEYKFQDSFHFAKYQLLYALVAFVLLFFISKINHCFINKYSYIFLLISFILLIIVLIPGFGLVRNGSRSWFAIGPFGFQPSELSKLSLIIYTAKYLSKQQVTFKNIVPLFLIIFIYFLLILLEPDFGSGMVIVLTLIVIIFISGLKINCFVYMGIFGLIAIILLVLIAPYRLARILSFINPWSDPLGSGYQIIQSLYAIGPGGIFGVGFGNSIQKHFYLPEPHTDFIFSIICEEFGILGIIVIGILFYILFKNIIKLALKSHNLFSKYLVFGLGFQIILQGLLNLCVVVGLIPVTGVTLPFISYGGSSLLSSLISIGIILGI